MADGGAIRLTGRMIAVLLRLIYLALIHLFAAMRLLARDSADKDVEILVLRHQLAVIQRRSSAPRLDRADRSLLAALLHRLPKTRLRQLSLLVSPDTVLRWHRDLLRRRWAAKSRPKQAGKPATRRNIQGLVARLARQNPPRGYRRVHGELAGLGITLAPSSVWEIFKRHSIDPPPRRVADRAEHSSFAGKPRPSSRPTSSPPRRSAAPQCMSSR